MPVAHKQGADRSGSEDLDENFFRLYHKPLPRDFGFLFDLSQPAKNPAEVLRRPATHLCRFGTRTIIRL